MYSKISLIQVLCLSLALIEINAYVRYPDERQSMNELQDNREFRGQEGEGRDGEQHHRHHHHKHHESGNDERDHQGKMGMFGEPSPRHHHQKHHNQHKHHLAAFGHAHIMQQLMPLMDALANRSYKKKSNLKTSSDVKVEAKEKSRAYVVSKWKTQTNEMFVNKQQNNASKLLTRTINSSGETDAVIDFNANMDITADKVLNSNKDIRSEPMKQDGLDKRHHHKHHGHHHHHHKDNEMQQQEQQRNQEFGGDDQQSHRRYRRDTTAEDGGHHDDQGQHKKDDGHQFIAKVGDIFKKAGQAISNAVKEYAPKFEKSVKEAVDKVFKPHPKTPPKTASGGGDSPTVAPKEGETEGGN